MTEQLLEIGTRLAALRDACDVTAEDMARTLEVTPEEYAAFERGERDFSFSFLYNAAEALGVDVLDIMSGESPKLSGCSVVKAGKGFKVDRNKAYEYRHLAFTFRDKRAEPFLVTVEPQEKTPALHAHEGQEFNYVLSGHPEFRIGDATHALSAGDSLYFDASLPHYIVAREGVPAQFLAVVVK